MGREGEVPVFMGFGDNSNHIPCVFYPGDLVPISSECMGRFTVNIYQRPRGRRFLYQRIGITQG